ncbi:MAG: DPP IV N-terminal domain-containing protein, partial [Gemmataceae bacterium]|nr:DPP IV N-terminal domain-containing protein [Gemmataceae bacterium]
ALARDLTSETGHQLLKDLVIVLVPILNADGNEKLGPGEKTRPGQNGPAEAGTRENAQGLDLNRDFVKLESPEVRALVKLVNNWDPAVVVDCHTTNGSKHRYTLTYDGPRYPFGQSQLTSWSSDTFLRDVRERVKADAGYDTAPYGNFSADRTKWETYPAGPRFGVQYFSLCGRIGVLSESYTYAPFKDRVKASYSFVKSCFEVAAARKDEVRKVTHRDPPWPASIPVRTKTVAHQSKLAVAGFEEVEQNGRKVATDRPKEYRLDFVSDVRPEVMVDRPLGGYLIPAEFTAAIDTIRRHGIKVEELLEDIELPVEAYQVRAVDAQARPFQNHKLVRVDVSRRAERRMVPAGTALVRTTQPLGTLAAYLLEPESEDGLVTWNYFDDALVPGKDFPVLRLPRERAVVTGAPRPLPEDRVTDRPIDDEVYLARGPQFLGGGSVGGVTWLPDGEHFLQAKGGKLLKVNARTGDGEPFVDPEKVKKSLAALKDLDAEAVERLATATSFQMNPQRTAFLVNVGPDYAFGYFDGRPAVRLTTKAQPGQKYLKVSPDGARVAYVRGQNLFAASADDPGERQLTADGGGDVYNAEGDWVYEEEIFLRGAVQRGAVWWSPDGKQLAFLRIDDAPVNKFTVVDYQPVRGKVEATPYPKAGDPNPTVRIGVVAATGGKPVFLDMGEYKPEDTVISRVGWTPKGAVFAYVQNRTQTWLDFVVWDTPAAKPRRLFRETTKAWVDDLGEPDFLPDGSFIVLCERSGWKHAYHYAADGKLLHQVTDGEWEARNVVRIDEAAGWVYFTGTKDGHTRSNLYRAKLDGTGGVERLTTTGGTHTVAVAPKGNLFLDRYTDDKTPSQLRLFEFGGHKPVRMLDKNPTYEKEQFKFGKYERLQVPTTDGFVLETAVTYPPDFDPEKKYPVWVLTYGGPNAPTVRDGFGGGRGLEQTLATSGIVVFRVDPRSASGMGASATWACYKQLGVSELKDLEDAVAWLAKKTPWVDTTRVGISGHSYGGFISAYALTHGNTFTAGVAGSAVTDWRLYDSIYTERYMLTPQENPDGYEKTSCVRAAKNLHGKLLITHGMRDDNVHLQNATQFVDALQRGNKDFEMMFYPQARHGIGGPHHSRTELEFIRRACGVKK